MKTGFRFAIATIGALVAASTGVAVGCTSSSSSGSGGTTASQYCSALSSYASKCNIDDPCTAATLQNCNAFAGVYSSAWLAAVTSCASQLSCADGGGAAANACLAAVESHPSPSASQEKLAEDYCAVCASSEMQTTAQCAQSFYAPTGDGSIGGLGNFFLDYNDTIVTSIDTQCVPGLGDAGVFGCDFTLLACADGVIGKSYTAPAACVSTSTGDAGSFNFDAGPIVFTFDAGNGGD
jgi:hypothetical protein